VEIAAITAIAIKLAASFRMELGDAAPIQVEFAAITEHAARMVTYVHTVGAKVTDFWGWSIKLWLRRLKILLEILRCKILFESILF
jgi:hypothetical protein